jgi:hypothetical protein
MTIKDILLVEDNEEFYKAAKIGVPFHIERARDYAQAQEIIAQRASKLEGALVDCFFPEQTGTGKRDLGMQVIQRIASHYPRPSEQAREVIDEVSKYAEMDPELRTLLTRYIFARGGPSKFDIRTDTVILSIEKVSLTGKYLAAHIAKNTLRPLFGDGTTGAQSAPKDHFGDLVTALEKDEANAPLGVAVADLLTEKRVPLVLVTSTNHHDSLTQPIQDYAGKYGWRLEDCSPQDVNGKASPEFWVRASNVLATKMYGGSL